MKTKTLTANSTNQHELGVRNLIRVRAGSCLFMAKFFILFFIGTVSIHAQSATQFPAQNATQFPAHQTAPWWLSLEQGKQRFRSGNYGAALMSFEDARRHRRAMYEQMEKDLIIFLSVNEVRRIGDSLDRVTQYSYDRLYTAASSAFEELFYRVPKSSFNNSAASALSAFARLKDYPEAEYWIGEVYRIEGELSLALSQYRKAYEMRGVMEDPGFYITVLYKISDVLRIRQEYTEMIRVLESIIAEKDTLWANASAAQAYVPGIDSKGNPLPRPYIQANSSFTVSAMITTLKDHGFNRFMVMYRYNNNAVEAAHRALGFHYVVQGRAAAEEHLMFAFLIQNSIIIQEIQRRQFDFLFTDLSSLAREINRNQLLLSYADEVEYYRTAYYFGASLHRNGKTQVARTIWTFLASQPQAGEWQRRAASQLSNPRFEPIVEMP